MPDLITLELAKQHLKVLHNREDSLIQMYLAASLKGVSDYLDRPFDGSDYIPFESTEVAGQPQANQPLVLHKPLVAATLLGLGDLYKNRDAQGEKAFNVNPTMERLMWPYRRMGV